MGLKKKKKNVLGNKKLLITRDYSKSPISEQYRVIRTNIQFTSIDEEIRSIMVTSSEPGEGKSTTVANLAIVFAQQGKKVLLIDADLRKPSIHYTFDLANIFGLTTILSKRIEMWNAIAKTDVENLFILTSGPVPPNPAELLSSLSMRNLIDQLKEQFDILLFDTPPLLAVTDGQIISNLCQGSILVIASGKTEKDKALKSKELLTNANSSLLGVVINKKKKSKKNQYYYYGE